MGRWIVRESREELRRDLMTAREQMEARREAEQYRQAIMAGAIVGAPAVEE